MRSVLECVLEHAKNSPDSDAVRLVSNRKPRGKRTFAEIAAGAERAAGFLAEKGVGPGSPVALIGSHHLDFYAAWLGCVWLGAIPTVLAEPSVRIDKEIYWSRLNVLLERNEVKTILLEPGVDVGRGSTKEVTQFTYEEVAGGGGPAPAKVDPEPDALIALQHSSGTTGLHKGVMLTHGMVMRHAEAWSDRVQMTPDDITVTWLPLYHDLGFICCYIMPLIVGSPLVWMSPFEWVTTPELLLESITLHKATIMWIPNFAFVFLAQGISNAPEEFDLSSMRLIFSGGEPTTEAALDTFYNRYKVAGCKREAIHVGYGMAEAVGMIAGTGGNAGSIKVARVSKRIWNEEHRAAPASEGEDAISQVGTGMPLKGVVFRIVGPEGEILPAGHAGRILLKTPYLLSGYYRRDDLNKTLYDADGFIDTGDAGYLDAEGQIFVTGRIKDLLKIGGKNVYPQDIEDVVNKITGVHPGRVVCFGVPLGARGTEGLVIVAEADLDEAEWHALSTRIRTAVVKHADVDVVDSKVVGRNVLRKSTAGKLARGSNREWYLEGRFGPLPRTVAAPPAKA
jgi:fatty-acyl-CoA synthase